MLSDRVRDEAKNKLLSAQKEIEARTSALDSERRKNSSEKACNPLYTPRWTSYRSSPDTPLPPRP